MAVRSHREAIADVVDARNWYEGARTSLGIAFVAEVERIVDLIDQFPSRFPFHDGHVRRASLRRFPFSVFFEQVKTDCYVWAVFHHRRNPRTVDQRRRS